MTPPALRLANDEYAAALLLAGAVELALGLLATGGTTPFSADDVMPRLAAGTAALAARGLVVDGQQTLAPDIEALVQTVARPSFTLYLRKTVAGVDDGLALHFRDAAIVAQHIDVVAAHTLTPVGSLDAAADAAAIFYGIDTALPSVEPFSLPGAAVSALLEATDAASRAAALNAAGIAALQPAFAADYLTQSLAGSFLRIDYAHGHPTTRAGAALIASSERTWLLRQDRKGGVQIMQATFLALQDELYLLSRL